MDADVCFLATLDDLLTATNRVSVFIPCGGNFEPNLDQVADVEAGHDVKTHTLVGQNGIGHQVEKICLVLIETCIKACSIKKGNPCIQMQKAENSPSNILEKQYAVGRVWCFRKDSVNPNSESYSGISTPFCLKPVVPSGMEACMSAFSA